MGENTLIHWTDSTMNPVMGCDGCELWQRTGQATKDDEAQATSAQPHNSCYAANLHETRGKGHKGFAPSFDQPTEFPGRSAKASRWSDLTGKSRADKPWLDTMPRLIFVSDMGDSLSRGISFEYLLAEVIDVARSSHGQRHIWQWLTKRPSRMARFSSWLSERGIAWPDNVWVGTSITTQSTLGRMTQLLRVGSETTTRFLSVEPQVEAIHIGESLRQLDWVIQGGESGKDSRPFNVAWARQLRDDCERSGVAYFLKQLGAHILDGGHRRKLKDSHGGEWDEWPADLRVRQMPHWPKVVEASAPDVASAPEVSSEGDEPATEVGGEAAAPSVSSFEPALGADSSVLETEGLEGTREAHSETDAEVTPLSGPAAREAETRLEALLDRLTQEHSDFAMARVLPEAKRLYEQLHPETTHGGDRQVARNATWPRFTLHVAHRTGRSEGTVRNRLQAGEALTALDPEAAEMAYGTALANQLGLLVRIAAIQKPEFHRDLVNIFINAGRATAKAELAKWEECDRASSPKPSKAEEEGDAAATEDSNEPAEGEANEEPEATDVTEEANAPTDAANPGVLSDIMAALGVTDPVECLPAIEELKALQPLVHKLRHSIAEAEAKAKRMEKELQVYRDAPMGELFRILGVKTARDALAKVRSIKEASNDAA